MRRIFLERIIDKQGLSITQVAESLKVTRQMISAIISCQKEPSWDLAQKLAQFFKIPAEQLLEINYTKSNKKLTDFPIKKLYDVDEFRSEVLNNKVSKSTIYAKIKSGEIKAVKIGRKPFIPAWFVDELLTSRNI